MAAVPPELFRRYEDLLREFRRLAPKLDPETAEDIQELFRNLDDDFNTGDVGFITDAMDEIQSLLQ